MSAAPAAARVLFLSGHQGMMLFKLLIMAPVLLAAPEVVVKWTSPRFEARRVQVQLRMICRASA